MTTTNRPTARIRINRTRTSTGKHGYDATVEVSMPIDLVGELTEHVSAIALGNLRRAALYESDTLVAELEQRVNEAEAPAADAGTG